MAGNAKPNANAIEGKYTYGKVNGTDYALDASTSIVGLFDGTQPNNWTGATVAYWANANQYVIVTLLETCNIWRCGTSSWSGSNNKLNIYRYNETTSAYVDVTSTYSKTTTKINEAQWEIFASKLPPGKYKFTGANGLRIDSEWFIESCFKPLFLNYNNEYYIPTAANYNQETGMFNSVDLATVKAATGKIELFADITVGEETFKPIDKFKDYPVRIGFNYNAEKIETEQYTSDKELIVGSGNIHLIIADNIDKFQLSYTKTNDNPAFVICSVDNNVTWLTYDFENVEFKPVDGINIASVASYSEMTEEQKIAYENSKTIIIENGISIDNIASVDWNLLKDANGEFPFGLKFAYCIVKTEFSDNTNITSLSWQFDAKGFFQIMAESECDIMVRKKYIQIDSLVDSEIIKIDIM